MEAGDIEPDVHARKPEDLLGSVLDGRYLIERVLGVGGMGAVYLAQHLVLREPRAVKVLSERFAFDTEWVDRFRLEAKASFRIDNEHVVRVLDLAAPAAGLLYMVMEFVPGESLADFARREGPIPWQRALRMADQIASALEKAHSQGIVHRDIKPGNCLRVTVGGNPDYIKVLDFGIAKFLESASESFEAPRTATDVWMGTPEYMAPERFRGQVDERVDIYALGVLVYRLMTGRTPFRGNHMDVSTQQMLRVADPPSRVAPDMGIPPAVDRLILHAIAPERSGRIPSMTALRAEFRALLSGRGPREELPDEDTTLVHAARKVPVVVAPPPKIATPTPVRLDAAAVRPAGMLASASPRRPWASTLLAGGLAAALLGGLVWLVMPDLDPQPSVSTTVDQAELQAQPGPATMERSEPRPVVAPPEVMAKPPEPELIGAPAAPVAAAETLVAGGSTTAPQTAGSPASTPVKSSAKKKPGPQKSKVEDPWRSSLEVDLALLEPSIQRACFLPNRARRGTEIVVDIEVGASGKAVTRVVTQKFPHISDCVRYWLNAHFFSQGSHGGSIRWRFVAR